MTPSRGRALAAVLLLSLPVSVRALSSEDQDVIERGFDALYRSDYDGSEKIFSEAIMIRPGDPPLSMGYAVATWWRMENDFAPPGSSEEGRFLDAVKNAIVD